MHIPVQQRNARDPSRAPLRGLIVRCRRKAMGPREEQSARVLRAEAKSEKRKAEAKQLLLLLLLLILGPVSRGEVRPESPVGSSARMRASSRMGRMPIERTPA